MNLEKNTGTSDFIKSFDVCLNMLFPESELRNKVNHRESAIDYVINNIKNKIFLGELKAGDKLPIEDDLAKELGVGRGSIREAIKVLQSIGIVKIIRGEGMFITDGDITKAVEPLLFNIILSKTNKSDLYKLRNMFEKAILQSIIMTRTKEDLESIKQIIEDTEKCIQETSDWEVFIKLDFKFHLKLASLVNNTLVESFYRIILNLSAPFIKETYFNNPNNEYHALEDHKNIYKTIEKQDMKAAEKAVNTSLNNWLTRSNTE